MCKAGSEAKGGIYGFCSTEDYGYEATNSLYYFVREDY